MAVAQDYYKAVTHEVLSNHPFPREPLPQRRRDPVILAPGYVPEGQATNVLKLRGLPWAARKHDIVNWLSSLPIQQLSTDRCVQEVPWPLTSPGRLRDEAL